MSHKSVQSELIAIGEDILACEEPVVICDYTDELMAAQWANDQAFTPGLFIEAILPKAVTIDVRRISSAVFGVMHPELGYSAIRVYRNPNVTRLYENDFGNWYLTQFQQYPNREHVLMPVGITGLGRVLAEHNNQRLAA